MTYTTDVSKFRVMRKLFKALLFGLFFFTLFANIYIPFDYALTMPRSSQPQTGRVYPIHAQYGGTVYVNRREYERRIFVQDYLTSAVGILVLLYIGTETVIARWVRGKTIDSERV